MSGTGTETRAAATAKAAVRATVVVPAYNDAGILPRTLEALLAQTLPPEQLEIVVVDDGSTDYTPQVLARYTDVHVIRQDNTGPAGARNRGAREALGDIVLFTDSDCAPEPDWAERMLAAFDDPAVVGAQGAYRTRQTGLAPRFAQAEFEDRYDLMAGYDSIDLISTYAAAYRRADFLELDGFDESFPVPNNEDTEFSYRMAAAGKKLAFVPDAIVYHRHPASLCDYLRVKFWRGYWRMVVYRMYPDKALKDRYTPQVLKLQTLAMLAALGLLPLALFLPSLLGLSGALGCFVLGSSLPFARKAARKDRGVGLATPWIVFCRSLVFACGSFLGIVRCLRGA